MAKVNKRELAEIVGVTERTLTNWQDEGMPIELVRARGGENDYDTAGVIAWMIDRAIKSAKLEKPRDRLSELQAQRLEIELAEKRGELVPAIEVGSGWTTMVTEARKEFLDLGIVLAPLLEQLVGIDPKRDLIDETVGEILDRLANAAEPADASPGPKDDAAVAPASTDATVGVGREEPADA